MKPENEIKKMRSLLKVQLLDSLGREGAFDNPMEYYTVRGALKALDHVLGEKGSDPTLTDRPIRLPKPLSITKELTRIKNKN